MGSEGADRPALNRASRALFLLVLLALMAGLLQLGVWQLHRRVWKLALIERVHQHLTAAPVAAPGPAQWSGIGFDAAYRRLRVEGVFHHALERCTQAVSELGAGCWVMTPLQTTEGWWLLVNRGFVDSAHRNPSSRAAGQVSGTVSVEGLLRLTERGGGFLHRNDPAHQRWYSRDVSAIAAAQGLPAAQVAPYFIDASKGVPGGPIAGLTVLRFNNNHLVYALTWFALAAMVLLAVVLVVRRERFLKRASVSGVNGQ